MNNYDKESYCDCTMSRIKFMLEWIIKLLGIKKGANL